MRRFLSPCAPTAQRTCAHAHQRGLVLVVHSPVCVPAPPVSSNRSPRPEPAPSSITVPCVSRLPPEPGVFLPVGSVQWYRYCCEVRLCDPCARVCPCVPCVSRLPPVSFYRYCAPVCPVCPVCVPAPPGVFLPVLYRYRIDAPRHRHSLPWPAV